MDTSKSYYAYADLELLRAQLLIDNHKIRRQDLGAGSKSLRSDEVMIKDIARSALSSPAQCRLLFNLVTRYKPLRILELGSSLGISTGYMAKANSNAQIITIEGDPEIAKIAQENFKQLNLSNIELLNKTFDEGIASLLDHQFDLIYIDGNHTEQATKHYFESLSSLLSDRGTMVFDDIYWSKGMHLAWEHIKTSGHFQVYIDLYQLGIAFKNPDLKQVQKLKLISYKWKPFEIGLFPRKQ